MSLLPPCRSVDESSKRALAPSMSFAFLQSDCFTLDIEEWNPCRRHAFQGHTSILRSTRKHVYTPSATLRVDLFGRSRQCTLRESSRSSEAQTPPPWRNEPHLDPVTTSARISSLALAGSPGPPMSPWRFAWKVASMGVVNMASSII